MGNILESEKEASLKEKILRKKNKISNLKLQHQQRIRELNEKHKKEIKKKDHIIQNLKDDLNPQLVKFFSSCDSMCRDKVMDEISFFLTDVFGEFVEETWKMRNIEREFSEVSFRSCLIFMIFNQIPRQWQDYEAPKEKLLSSALKIMEVSKIFLGIEQEKLILLQDFLNKYLDLFLKMKNLNLNFFCFSDSGNEEWNPSFAEKTEDGFLVHVKHNLRPGVVFGCNLSEMESRICMRAQVSTELKQKLQ